MALRPDTEPAGRSRLTRSVRRATWTGVDQGSMMGMELVSGILVWAGIGWLLDRWLGTTPWLLAVGVFVGFGGGLYLVWLRSGRMEGARPAGSAEDARPASGAEGGPPDG